MSLPLPDQATPANVTAADVLHAVGATGAAGVANAWEPWERIAPLTPRRLLPPFPIHLLPSWVRVYVVEVTEALQVPGDLPGCLAIAALAVATGGRVDVIPMRGWVEPTNVYVVIALAPGSRKSAAFSAMTRPLYDAEAALVQATAPERIQAALVARRTNAQADKAAHAAESADANPNAPAQLGTTGSAARRAFNSLSICAIFTSLSGYRQKSANETTPINAGTMLISQTRLSRTLGDCATFGMKPAASSM